jgi:hypothetical protein
VRFAGVNWLRRDRGIRKAHAAAAGRRVLRGNSPGSSCIASWRAGGLVDASVGRSERTDESSSHARLEGTGTARRSRPEGLAKTGTAPSRSPQILGRRTRFAGESEGSEVGPNEPLQTSSSTGRTGKRMQVVESESRQSDALRV